MYYLIGLILVSVLGFIGYQVYTFLLGISSTQSVYLKDLQLLQKVLEDRELAPWKEDEIDILSRIGDSNIERTIYGNIEHGVVYSIYHEPILAFATKKYSADEKLIISMKINSDYYGFICTDDIWKVSKNDVFYGSIDNREGLLLTSNSNNLSFETNSNAELVPVIYNDINVASINTNDQIKQSRVINPLIEFDAQQAELFLVGLGFAIMVKQI
jgi:hypothetical protein